MSETQVRNSGKKALITTLPMTSVGRALRRQKPKEGTQHIQVLDA